MPDFILEMRNITKEFPGVKALNGVNLSVRKGEIHALVGENGAGKSTLMNVLSGVYPHGSYTGKIIYEGNECQFKVIRDSERQGIAIIHQELALIPYLSIGENMYLGNERARSGVIDWNRTYKEAKELLRKVGLKDDPDTAIKDIGVGKQQLVEIAKALSKNVKLLILDEPTAALNEEDSDNLLRLLLAFKKEGMTAILISHKLNEVVKVADRITVLRDGSTIETMDALGEEISEERIIKGMVGRELTDRFPKRTSQIGDIALEIKDWRVDHPTFADKQMVRGVSLYVRKGEVIGISGLMGAGRTELAMSVFGRAYGRNIKGTLYKDGKEIKLSSVRQAINHGLAYATEDRKTAGLVLIDSVKRNISLPGLSKISRNSIVDIYREGNVAEEYRKKINIKSPTVEQKVGNLSGGNQQKVVLSKWIFSAPDIFILDEPTRGIDIGAKYEIYCIINDLVKQGKSVIMISSELPEILGMCDRIYVMNEGRICGELPRKDASQESIMKCIMDSESKEMKAGQNESAADSASKQKEAI